MLAASVGVRSVFASRTSTRTAAWSNSVRRAALSAGNPSRQPSLAVWSSTPPLAAPCCPPTLCCVTATAARSPAAATTTCGKRLGDRLPWVAAQGISTHWLRHTTLTWVERHHGYGIARAYAGHTDNTGPATTTYIKASLQEVATALAAMTGQPHPLALP